MDLDKNAQNKIYFRSRRIKPYNLVSTKAFHIAAWVFIFFYIFIIIAMIAARDFTIGILVAVSLLFLALGLIPLYKGGNHATYQRQKHRRPQSSKGVPK